MLKIVEIKEATLANQIETLSKQAAINKTENETSSTEFKAYCRSDLFMNFIRSKIQPSFMVIVDEKLASIKVEVISST